ncbi:hypothetical protein PR048_022487 [Dryococelus australis]|uniref:Uncharacterized protein n=1 Tax=Dryococelus australis TaxID=614101 RepID=A0ABQ9H147_9NEOP|nr:hypothetical protein PR048_022487 [Dryococelus australis]
MEVVKSEVAERNVPVREVILPPEADFDVDDPSSIETLAALTPVGEQQSASETMRQQAAPSVGAATPPFVPPCLHSHTLEDSAANAAEKVQKPRVGVRMPSRSLTSRIVTQEEIAKELLERTLKKYPVTDFPEGGDYFFAWKLTQRLANHLAPADTSPTKMDQEPSSGEFPVSSAAIPDDKELLAILEGDSINDWMPKTKPEPKPKPPPHQPVPFKLDPELERQLALKQLMEMPIRTKKKPEEKKEKQPRKPRMHKKLKEEINIPVLQNNSQEGQQTPTKVKQVRRKRSGNNVSEPLAKKSCNSGAVDPKLGNCIVPKVKVQQSLSNGVVRAKMQSKTIYGSSKLATPVVAVAKDRVSHPHVSSSKGPIPVTKAHVSDNIPNQSFLDNDDKITLPQSCSANTTMSCAIPMVTTSRLTAPPRTYGSPKKRFVKPEDGRSVVQQNVATECTIETKDTVVIPNVETTAKTELSDEKILSVDSTSRDGGKKKNRMREVDRLLMDEGAINLLYEAEQSESKRRSGPEKVPAGLKRPTSPLKSIRRKKKDLLLKTRLVKNAVMRLSSSPSSAGPLALRTKRLGGNSLPLPGSPPQHKPSLDSQGSLCSPPPEPPSPTSSLPYSPRLQLPAEASRIIRRHSSSSNFSSRSTSPNTMRRPSLDQEEPVPTPGTVDDEVKRKVPVRKKGVPIFVRKTSKVQTYLGKQKPARHKFLADSGKGAVQVAVGKLRVESAQHDVTKKQMSGGTVDVKRKACEIANGSKKIGSMDKQRLKAQMARNFHRGIEKGKVLKLKKNSAEDKVDKKQGEEKADKKQVKKSHSSSPSSSRSSSVPLTPTTKKNPSVPLSPGASSKYLKVLFGLSIIDGFHSVIVRLPYVVTVLLQYIVRL